MECVSKFKICVIVIRLEPLTFLREARGSAMWVNLDKDTRLETYAYLFDKLLKCHVNIIIIG